MATEHVTPIDEPSEKLLLLKSPVTFREVPDGSEPLSNNDGPDLSHFGDRYQDDCPQFQKHDDATLLELFYDLFFAANYTVFSQTQGVNSHARFKAYVGYFCILWMTWLSVSLYDVRFVTDSIFERAARGVQLGVLVGFAVVAPNFKPDDQNIQTMRTMSLILAVSRFCLAVNYGSILWHIRSFKKQRLPMILQIALNFLLAILFLGLTFAFKDKHGHGFVAWYALSCFEVAMTFVFSIIFPVLSFNGTHLMKRVTVLTVMILGDGVVIMAQNVVTIVKSPDAWDSQTIGIVTAAATTIYFVFLVYFDWMKTTSLPDIRHCLWTLIHFPFHIALVLFMQGFTQFIIWSKIIDVENHLNFDFILNDPDKLAASTSEDVGNAVSKLAEDFFKTYKPQYYDTWQAVENSVANVTSISDDFWPQFANYVATNQGAEDLPYNDTEILSYSLDNVLAAMENALLETFGIDLIKEMQDGDDAQQAQLEDANLQFNLNQKTWERFNLVFCYAYIATGLTLLFMVLLTVVSRTKSWGRWAIIRTAIFTMLAIGTSLISLLYLSPGKVEDFKNSPWLLPVICMLWIVVLFFTHVRNPPPIFFPYRSKDKGDVRRYDSVTFLPSGSVDRRS
ncbi:bacterial low temperature requirement a [Fusarium albosuccineum]|uniref:Bacterial low temperature requirement a n=1 Tax=Fusarium albosuccineum TaxID=1237068 RepID=A0A8H4KSY2_9HYPO|nr:bacterial low temperature requirement a [Fusarium albosuccineum]